ncbi:MAG: hypothetical protein LBS90_07725 [Oscillospiraceae bacterium]|jgi:hypothetical protein|nr:hypothetical protein [Oscillospiraceae bacterium]
MLVFIRIVVGVLFGGAIIVTGIVWPYKKRQKKIAAVRQRRTDVATKYGTEACGVFKLYGGLPLSQDTDCEVAYVNGDIIISAGHFDKRIPAGDIVNIRHDDIQEGYTKTSVFGFSGVGVALGAASAVGNAVKKASAQKTLLIITCADEEIAFLSQKLSDASGETNLGNSVATLAEIYGGKHYGDLGRSAGKIIAAFAADRYKQK